MVMFFLILALVFVVLLVIITNIVIVPQSRGMSLSGWAATPTHGRHACTLRFPSSSALPKR